MSAQSNQHNQTVHHVGLKSRFRLRHRRDDSSAVLKRSRSSRGSRRRDSETTFGSRCVRLGELRSNAFWNNVRNKATHGTPTLSWGRADEEKPREARLAATNTHTHAHSHGMQSQLHQTRNFMSYVENLGLAFVSLFSCFHSLCCSCRSIGNSTEDTNHIETSKSFYLF